MSINHDMNLYGAILGGLVRARVAVHPVLVVGAVNGSYSPDFGAIAILRLVAWVLPRKCLILKLSPIAASFKSPIEHCAVCLRAGQVLEVAAFDGGTANRARGDGVGCGLRFR